MRLRPGEVLERGGRGGRSDRGGGGVEAEAGWRQSDVGKRELVQASSSSGGGATAGETVDRSFSAKF